MVYGPPFPPFDLPLGTRRTGSVWPVPKGKLIVRRFGRDYYRLHAYSFFRDLAWSFADKLAKQTGKNVKVASFQNPQISRGLFVDCGIWVDTGKSRRSHPKSESKSRAKGGKR